MPNPAEMPQRASAEELLGAQPEQEIDAGEVELGKPAEVIEGNFGDGVSEAHERVSRTVAGEQAQRADRARTQRDLEEIRESLGKIKPEVELMEATEPPKPGDNLVADNELAIDGQMKRVVNKARQDARRLNFVQRTTAKVLPLILGASAFIGLKSAEANSNINLENKAVGGSERVDKNAELRRAENFEYLAKDGDSVDGIFRDYYEAEGYGLSTFKDEVKRRNPGRFEPNAEGVTESGLKEGEIIILPYVEELNQRKLTV